MFINIYELDFEEKQKNSLLDMISFFHSSKPIILENSISIISIAKEDFSKLFNINYHKDLNKNKNQEYYLELLNKILEKRYYENDNEIFLNLIIDFDISNNEIFEIIQNHKMIESYIFIENIFIISTYSITKNKNIFNLSINTICDGYCPKFKINHGFYDNYNRIEYNTIINILNECYINYVHKSNKQIFQNLIYKS